ncbi:hypothetical protein PROFUN_09654 [Planoprotostelium fungivorum]|uniref:Uncharacterized protein n=1 Tax=Planoprotostelium fungivorum TaxID=1890364 RepID=A0A2P6NGH4_9EUKA|nr:hypothetical protein PROFUN_09654 [Planoprotostelium fungivorum]
MDVLAQAHYQELVAFLPTLDVFILLYFNLDNGVCLLWITAQVADRAGAALWSLRLAHLLAVLEEEDVRIVF